ncbi:hypothetical protein EU523_01985 [Candidatus Heimdallarchaeota archaeon]|nr:MAG: hypothetical protein EU523_01985 [Candidatus Heimdallarchaeota archaeon]
MPQFENKTEQIAVYDGKSYPFIEGDHKELLSGKVTSPENYKPNLFAEETREYSQAKFSTLENGDVYYVSPLARININHNFLVDEAKETLNSLGLKLPDFNPFNNNLARVVELMHCTIEAMDIIDKYIAKEPVNENKKFEIKAGSGAIATEAPRGLLNHSYEVNSEGIITKADVITPTAHNQTKMEDDARKFAPTIVDKKDDEIKLLLNMLIRSYDPCISCATHSINVDLKRI